MVRPRVVVATLALLGASLLPTVVAAAPLQPNEIGLTIDSVQYGCVEDPSSWRAPTPAHDALVDQGYSVSIWLATHPGFAPFSDHYYFLCRAVDEPA